MRRINIQILIIVYSLLHQFAFSQQEKEPMKTGVFKPNWTSLEQYEVPDWFRDAKFGIWAHWGPQCQPEAGDWYGRNMYNEGSRQYNHHLEHYGHPSEVGFKDIIHQWKADKWNPEQLLTLYKKAGARYFMAMGNHHDNFDLWNSDYQEWNSVALGPKRNILEDWSQAAKKLQLPFGVSIHAAHAWQWYEASQGADTTGALAGIPYDGKLTKEDGKGTWWDGLDPQHLYAQNHPLSKKSKENGVTDDQWNWKNGASIPSKTYALNFYNRTVDMINKFNPDLLYFDDTALPLWPVSNVGLEIAAHYYNTNTSLHQGNMQAVLFGKILSEPQKECLVWDVERGAPDSIQEKPWQTCTCIGNWHYNQDVYDNDQYKSATTVIQMLVDIVSKNGNLLLSIPIKGDGSLDDKEVKILEGITQWMEVNSECIYETRPWLVYGEGPKVSTSKPITAQGFNEGNGSAYTDKDIRFTEKGETLYAIVMDWPKEDNKVLITSLSTITNKARKYTTVSLLGNTLKDFSFTTEGLWVSLPTTKRNNGPFVLKIK